MPTSNPPSEDLSQKIVRLIRTRDRTGLVLLHDNYSAALYRILLERLPQSEVAQEALQDVLMKAWDNMDQYKEGKGRLFTWLARIARNTAIDITRSKNFKQDGKTQTLPDYVYNDSNLSEDARINDPGLRNVLKTLSQDEQRIINLLYFKGYTQKEASEALDMPLGTVKTRVRKAISTLRSVLGDEGLMRLLF